MLKNHPPKPANPPRLLARFLQAKIHFFYTLSIYLNKLNKNLKTFETQGLEPLSKSLSIL